MKDTTQMSLERKIIGEPKSPPLLFSSLVILALLLLGLAVGIFSPVYSTVIVGMLIMVIILLMRLDELTVTLIVATHILVDTYLNFDVYQVALIMSLILLVACCFGRSNTHPWTRPRLFWLWGLFLILNIYPTINGGAFSLTNSIASYFNLVLSAFLMFWLGNIIAKDVSSVRRVFQLLVVLATLIAIHTIIQTITGKFLFENASAEATLLQYSNFQAEGASYISRSGSYFVNPNGNGIFLATCIFLSLGLMVESKQLWAKAIYILGILLIALALLFTYSTGSWIAVLAGMVIFIFLAGDIQKGMLSFILVIILPIIAFTVFPSQIAAGLDHANNSGHILDHLGTIQTAIRVIEAYPFFGVGLGSYAYLVLAEPYRVAAQSVPQLEPDNSYLQWGATAGIPVMLVFLLLLGFVFWFAWCNWRAIGIRYRPLVGGGLVALLVFSINSLVVDGWTAVNGLEYLSWLIAGIVASPLIGRGPRQRSAPPVDRMAEIVHILAETSRIDKS